MWNSTWSSPPQDRFACFVYCRGLAMDWTKRRLRPPNKSVSALRAEMGRQSIRMVVSGSSSVCRRFGGWMSKLNRCRLALVVLGLLVFCSGHDVLAKKKTPPPQTEVWNSDPKFDMVVDKITVQEGLFVKNLKDYTPMVETYIQNMRSDQDLGRVPTSDEY